MNIFEYKCGVCDEKFKSRADVAGHIDTHFEKPNYRCSECLLDFTCPPSGYLHIKKVHGKGKASLKMETSQSIKDKRQQYTIKIDSETTGESRKAGRPKVKA